MNGSTAALVDTNVFVYAVNASQPAKQERAIVLLSRLEALKAGAITVQVLNEFFVVAARKAVPPLPPGNTERLIVIYTQTWPVLDLTPRTTLEAV